MKWEGADLGHSPPLTDLCDMILSSQLALEAGGFLPTRKELTQSCIFTQNFFEEGGWLIWFGYQ